jgi:hypothetical protein
VAAVKKQAFLPAFGVNDDLRPTVERWLDDDGQAIGLSLGLAAYELVEVTICEAEVLVDKLSAALDEIRQANKQPGEKLWHEE